MMRLKVFATLIFLLIPMKSYAQNLDMILCVDVSRSISPDRLKSALEAVTERLTNDDSVDLVLFADRAVYERVYTGNRIRRMVREGLDLTNLITGDVLDTNKTDYRNLRELIRVILNAWCRDTNGCARMIMDRRRPVVVIISDGEQDSNKSQSVKKQIDELRHDLFSFEISTQEYSISVDVHFFVISHHSIINANEKRQLWQRIANGSRFFSYHDMTTQITADSIYGKITEGPTVYFKPCFRISGEDLKFRYRTSSLAAGARVPIRIEVYRERDGSQFWTNPDIDLLPSASWKNETITDYFKNLDIRSNLSEIFDVHMRLISNSKTRQVMLIPTRIKKVQIIDEVHIDLKLYNPYSGDYLFNVTGGTHQDLKAQYRTIGGSSKEEPEPVLINTDYRPRCKFKKAVHLRFLDNLGNPVKIHLRHQPFPYSLFNHSKFNPEPVDKLDIVSIDSLFPQLLFNLYKWTLIFGTVVFGTYLLCFFMIKDRKELICKIKKIGDNINILVCCP